MFVAVAALATSSICSRYVTHFPRIRFGYRGGNAQLSCSYNARRAGVAF